MLRYVLAIAVCVCSTEDFGARRTADRRAVQFSKAYPSLGAAGERNQVFLWKFLESSLGHEVQPHLQSSEGDCVGQAYAMGVDLLTATEIHLLKEQERWVAKASVEMIYAGSRVEVGGKELLGRPGSMGEWGAEYLKRYGVLHRIKYGDIDLTGYDPLRSRKYRDRGVPDRLEPIARQHPVQRYTVIKNFDEACDAMAGGQPIIICASYAPKLDRNKKAHRDKDGFIKLETGCGCGRSWCFRRRKIWQHAWCAIGFDRKSDKPGLYIINSHGPDWIDGPRPHGLPQGAFKLTPEHANLMIQDWGDAYAISAYVGHPGDRVQKLRRFKLYL
jgi:hypothetical protein